jgi:hypothetical protein
MRHAQILRDFIALPGRGHWKSRMAALEAKGGRQSLSGRALQQRYGVELTLARLARDSAALARATPPQLRLLALAREAVVLDASLPAPQRERLRGRLAEALSGEGTLIPLFHLLRSAALQRERGFEVRFSGLLDGTPHDLEISREGATAFLACETVSAEEGRPLHRGDWFTLVDLVNPELQTWLAAHPGRYLLKMTLPEGIQEPSQINDLHRRILELLQAQRRQDLDGAATLRLDPLMLAGAHLAGQGLPRHLRDQFGPEAHLAVTGAPGSGGSGSVFVMAARAGRENAIAQAVTRRMAQAAESRFERDGKGILSVFIEDIDREEWRGLRDRLELEGAARRFLTEPAARALLAASCASRMELFGMAAPDAAPEGELRFRNPLHPAARLPALQPAIASSL